MNPFFFFFWPAVSKNFSKHLKINFIYLFYKHLNFIKVFEFRICWKLYLFIYLFIQSFYQHLNFRKVCEINLCRKNIYLFYQHFLFNDWLIDWFALKFQYNFRNYKIALPSAKIVGNFFWKTTGITKKQNITFLNWHMCYSYRLMPHGWISESDSAQYISLSIIDTDSSFLKHLVKHNVVHTGEINFTLGESTICWKWRPRQWSVCVWKKCAKVHDTCLYLWKHFIKIYRSVPAVLTWDLYLWDL